MLTVVFIAIALAMTLAILYIRSLPIPASSPGGEKRSETTDDKKEEKKKDKKWIGALGVLYTLSGIFIITAFIAYDPLRWLAQEGGTRVFTNIGITLFLAGLIISISLFLYTGEKFEWKTPIMVTVSILTAVIGITLVWKYVGITDDTLSKLGVVVQSYWWVILLITGLILIIIFTKGLMKWIAGIAILLLLASFFPTVRAWVMDTVATNMVARPATPAVESYPVNSREFTKIQALTAEVVSKYEQTWLVDQGMEVHFYLQENMPTEDDKPTTIMIGGQGTSNPQPLNGTIWAIIALPEGATSHIDATVDRAFRKVL